MTEHPPPRATAWEWLGLAVLALPTLLVAINMTVLFLALPELSADLQASGPQQLWITDIYGFLVAGFLITMGTLGDQVGRRRLLLVGAAAFGLTSVLAAYSGTAEMLIATRALMGIAGATLMPSTLSLVRTMFADPRQRTAAIAVWMVTLSVGTALGPLLSGVLLQYFWWGSTLLVGVPVLALLLVAGPVLLPEYRAPDAGTLDLVSVALSLASILSVVYGLKQFTTDGLTGTTALAVVIGLITGAVFVRRQRTLPDPLLDLRLFRDRAFSSALVLITLTLFAFAGNQLLFSLYLQHITGLSPLWAGVWMAPSAAALLVGSLLAPLAVRWMRPAFAVSSGLVAAAAGFALLTQLSAPYAGGTASLSFLLLQIGIAVAFFGLGPPFVLGADLVVGTAPPEKAGSASAMEETAAELGDRARGSRSWAASAPLCTAAGWLLSSVPMCHRRRPGPRATASTVRWPRPTGWSRGCWTPLARRSRTASRWPAVSAPSPWPRSPLSGRFCCATWAPRPGADLRRRQRTRRGPRPGKGPSPPEWSAKGRGRSAGRGTGRTQVMARAGLAGHHLALDDPAGPTPAASAGRCTRPRARRAGGPRRS